MAAVTNWQRNLRLYPEWNLAEKREIPVQKLAAIVADRLRKLRPFGRDDIDVERDELADEFESSLKRRTLISRTSMASCNSSTIGLTRR